MATVKGTNSTKYDNGGSGDNVIDDGFIKTVEKVWLDTYSVAAVIPTTTSILIARVPKNKKVTDIVVHMPVVGSPATATTIYCCTGATTSTSPYFGILGNGTQSLTFDCGTASTLRLAGNGTKMGVALPADVGIYLVISPATTVTGGTIRTIVKYT
jgi:hypothetical protein